MSAPRFLSLRWRLMGPLLGVWAMGLVLLVGILYASILERFRTLVDQRADVMVAAVYSAAETAREPADLRRFISTLGASRDVRRVTLLAGSPLRVVAASDHGLHGKPADALEPAIVLPNEVRTFTVGEDGTVSVTTAGNPQPQIIGNLQLADFVNPAGLQPVGENLYVETQSSGAPVQGVAGTDGLGVIKQGMLETSNVNVTEELVNLIQAQRVYEMNSKVISAVDSMMSFLTQRT